MKADLKERIELLGDIKELLHALKADAEGLEIDDEA